MERGKRNEFLNWETALVWMAVIFYFSSMPGSGYHSTNIFYFIERKTFHVFEYLILTILLFYALRQDFVRKQSLIAGAIIGFLYAISDEWHQTFVFGREGTLRDVLIDLIGIAIAVIFIAKFKKWKKEEKRSN